MSTHKLLGLGDRPTGPIIALKDVLPGTPVFIIEYWHEGVDDPHISPDWAMVDEERNYLIWLSGGVLDGLSCVDETATVCIELGPNEALVL